MLGERAAPGSGQGGPRRRPDGRLLAAGPWGAAASPRGCGVVRPIDEGAGRKGCAPLRGCGSGPTAGGAGGRAAGGGGVRRCYWRR